jgi:hypothetical protein
LIFLIDNFLRLLSQIAPDMGTHVKSLESKLKPLERKTLHQNATKFLESCCIYLLKHLPTENQVVRDARYLQFSFREKKAGTNAISRLSLLIGKTLGSEGLSLYFGSNIKTHYDLCDKVKHEYSLYQMEKIPDTFISKEQETLVNRPQQATSYWKEAYGLLDIEMYSSSNSYRGCDEFWVDVSRLHKVSFFATKFLDTK